MEAGLTIYPAAANVLPFVVREAGARGVPVAIVLGTIAVESRFKASAYRAEPHIKDASRGLMQLLFRTAQGLGYTGTPDGLYDPAVNIALGTQYLADGIAKYPNDVWAAVSRYNNGHGRRATKVTTTCRWRKPDGTCGESFTAQPGEFLNQPYVDDVREAARLFGLEGDGTLAAGLAGGPLGPLVLLGILGALARRHFT